MLKFIATMVAALSFYLLLAIGTGNIFTISKEQIIMGIAISFIVGVIGKNYLIGSNTRMLNPIRWFSFIAYIIPFLIDLIKANIDVALRVITGKINPGIVKIPTDLKTDIGKTMLANSITLTPGTLTVDINEDTNDFYIHCISVKEKEPKNSESVSGSFEKWIKRIAE